MQKLVDDFAELMDQGMEKELIILDCDLDGTFSSVRTRETNLGNLVADIMMRATKADAALLNGGCLRSDAIHEKGPLKMKVSGHPSCPARCFVKNEFAGVRKYAVVTTMG